MKYNWDKIKETLIKELKPIFDDANQPNFDFSFSDGLDLFCKTLMFKTGESDLDGIEIKVIPTIDKYYHSAKDKNDSFNYLTQISTKLDPYLQKIVYLFYNEDYIRLKSQRRGMFHFVNKCGINVNNIDFRLPISSIPTSLLSTNFGTHLYNAYSLRNIEAHTATDYNDDEIPKCVKDSLVIYLFTTFQYYTQLLEQVSDISIPEYIEIYEVVKELTPPREYEVDLINVIGRENELIKLKQEIGNRNNKIVAINGIGGLGKTTLLKYYIKQNRLSFNHIIWINFQNNLVYSFINNVILLDNLNISFPTGIPDFDKYKLLMNRISKLSGKTLLIIDNLEIDNVDSLSQLPLKESCQIITSTRANFTNPIINVFKIDTLDFESAKSLFLKHHNGSVDDILLKELFELIEYHTLTIELLAKTLSSNFLISGIAELIEYLKANSISSDDWQVSVQSEYDNKYISLKHHLLNAFNIVPLSVMEKEILLLFSVLPILQFSGSELKKLFSIEDTENANFIDSLNSLVSKGWLSEINSFFQIHSVLQEVIKIKTPPTTSNCSPLITGLIKYLDISNFISITEKIKYISCSEYISSLIPLESDEIMTLNLLLATNLQTKGDLLNALNYAQKTLDYAERTESDKVTGAYSILGVINRRLGKLDTAFNFYTKAIDKIESSHNKYVTDLPIYGNFGTLLEQMGEEEHLIQAKELYEYVDRELSYFIQKNGTEPKYSILLAINLSSLGKIYILLDDYEKAIEILQKSYTDLINLLGAKHETISICANNLGLAYGYNKNYEKSLEYRKKAVEIQEEIFEESHPELGISKSGLASAYRDNGDIPKAKALFKEVLDNAEKYLPPKHPAVARRKSNYAVVCEPNIAKKLYYESIEIDLHNYGPNNPNIGITNFNLGVLFINEKKWSSADKHLIIAKKIFDYNNINNSFSRETIKCLEFVKNSA